MKVLLVLSVAALATTEAAQCTNETLMVLQAKPEFKTVETACANISTIAASGASMDNLEKICKESECMATLANSYYSFPDCTTEGVNLQEYYQSLYNAIRGSCNQYFGVTLPRPTEASSATSVGVAFSLVVAGVGVVAIS